jgi:hypothetical protein
VSPSCSHKGCTFCKHVAHSQYIHRSTNTPFLSTTSSDDTSKMAYRSKKNNSHRPPPTITRRDFVKKSYDNDDLFNCFLCNRTFPPEVHHTSFLYHRNRRNFFLLFCALKELRPMQSIEQQVTEWMDQLHDDIELPIPETGKPSFESLRMPS